jgi:hypothetical protein
MFRAFKQANTAQTNSYPYVNNTTSGGTMLSHVVFSAIGKSANDSLTINWTITVG